MRTSLRVQVVLSTFLPLILAGVLGCTVAAVAVSRIVQDLVLERQTTLSQVAAAGVAGNLASRVRLLETVAGELGQYTGDASRQQHILADRASVLQDFDAGVGLLDEGGTAIAATPGFESDLGINYGYQPYFREARATGVPVFSSAFQDYPSMQPVVAVAIPVKPGSEIQGVLVGQFKLAAGGWAHNDLDVLQAQHGVVVYLVDNAGTVIYHPDASRVGASMQSDPQLWRLLLGQHAASIIYQPATGGPPIVATLAPIPQVAWGLVVEEPWYAILQPVEAYEWAAASLIGLGILAALAALLISLNRVMRPLNALVAEAQHMDEGRHFQPLPIAGPTDVRRLLQRINQMVTRLEQQQAALRDYATRVLRGEENERLRLSRDLHDQTIQDLIALAQRIDLLGTEVNEDPAGAKARLRTIRDLLLKTIKDLRRMSHNLRPAVLEDLGLVAALGALAQELEQAIPQATVRYETVGQSIALPSELELTILRIAQEALNNIRKHAPAATQVNMALIYEERCVQLMVEDDGAGFDVPNGESLLREGHLGLAGMIERAHLFDGELTISSEPGEGTTIHLRIPLRAEQLKWSTQFAPMSEVSPSDATRNELIN
jgi:signal transduction histidine kinase